MDSATYIPQSVRATLWSYDTNQIDLMRDKERIITNVLNYGVKEATDWLRATYSTKEIAAIVAHPRPGEWDKKSLNFWSLVFGVSPELRQRF